MGGFSNETILKDSDGVPINPAKEDGNLLSIKTQADKLTFDGDNLKASVSVNDSTDTQINPAEEDGNLKSIVDQLQKQNSEGVHLLGENGITSQQNKEQSEYDPINALMTFDKNLAQVLGTQPLRNQKNRLEVDAAQVSDTIVMGMMNAANKEVIINLDGQQTVAVQFSGTWAGTQSFYATVNGITWAVIYGTNITVLTAQITSTTASTNVFVFSVAGFKAFKVQTTAYTSGTCIATIRASNALTNFKSQYVTGTVIAQGSQTQNIQQRATTYETIVYDEATAALNSVLVPIEPWNPGCSTYKPGDCVLYTNNQIYQCIAAPGSTVANLIPTNGTYWQLDRRQNRNVITNTYISPANSQRIRVEIDMDGYQYRLAEEQMLALQRTEQENLIFQDYQLQLQEGGNSGLYGRNYAQGMSGMSKYISTEIR